MKITALLFLSSALALGQAPCDKPKDLSGCASNSSITASTSVGIIAAFKDYESPADSSVCGQNGMEKGGMCSMILAFPAQRKDLKCVFTPPKLNHGGVVLCTWKPKEKK